MGPACREVPRPFPWGTGVVFEGFNGSCSKYGPSPPIAVLKSRWRNKRLCTTMAYASTWLFASGCVAKAASCSECELPPCLCSGRWEFMSSCAAAILCSSHKETALFPSPWKRPTAETALSRPLISRKVIQSWRLGISTGQRSPSLLVINRIDGFTAGLGSPVKRVGHP